MYPFEFAATLETAPNYYRNRRRLLQQMGDNTNGQTTQQYKVCTSLCPPPLLLTQS